MLRKIIEKLNGLPIPYYVAHAITALAIASVLYPLLGWPAGLMAGMFFYIGREFTQWESGLPFDWKGLAAPVVVCLAALGTYFFL